MKPVTQYTKSGRINIAYQVFGTGSVDLVYIPGWVSNIDLMWGCPELVDFLQELGKSTRVILFDKRGTGLSDRVVELSTLEERMDDIRAVMDAVGSEKAVLFGHSEGGSVSALFAATYPNRTISLITFGVFAKRRYAPDYPWAPTDEERQLVYDMIEKSWGSGEMGLESLAPSMANDKVFMDWLANYFRSGASPSAAMMLTKMNTQVDIINILGSIKVPTLLMQRTHDIDVKIEEGKFIAERIKGSRFVEFEGDDHLFWVGNRVEILDEMKAFILNKKPEKIYEERLYTILVARVIATEQTGGNIQDIINQYVSQYKGKVVQYDKNTCIVTFEGPSKAVHCGMDLVDAIGRMDAELAIGIHIREGAIDTSHFISEETMSFAGSMLEVAKPGMVLITQSVKYLLFGSGLILLPNEDAFQPISGNSLSLFQVFDDSKSGFLPDDLPHPQVTRNDSFLENVLQSIEQHLNNESFGVEMLCREIGMSERQLQRKLKAITHRSPNQMISSVRLHRAKELILSQQYNIAEIAFQTGFSSPSYFSKSFKKEFGISPTRILKIAI